MSWESMTQPTICITSGVHRYEIQCHRQDSAWNYAMSEEEEDASVLINCDKSNNENQYAGNHTAGMPCAAGAQPKRGYQLYTGALVMVHKINTCTYIPECEQTHNSPCVSSSTPQTLLQRGPRSQQLLLQWLLPLQIYRQIYLQIYLQKAQE